MRPFPRQVFIDSAVVILFFGTRASVRLTPLPGARLVAVFGPANKRSSRWRSCRACSADQVLVAAQNVVEFAVCHTCKVIVMV
jgi:hypothetical protein